MTIKVIPPEGSVKDQTLQEFIVKFWKYLCPLPKDQSPAWNNDGSKDESFNERIGEDLFMLCFSREPQDTVTRTCNVPTNKGLFIPVMSVEVSQCEKPKATENELRKIADKDQASIHPKSLHLELDGVPLDLARYRFDGQQGPKLDVTFPTDEENAIFPNITTNSCEAVAAGHYVWTEPLSLGQHTIRWKGNLECSPSEECIDENYLEDITYQVNVVK